MHTPWIITIYELTDDLRTLWRIFMYRLTDIVANEPSPGSTREVQ
jgi:hypothetical protein